MPARLVAAFALVAFAACSGEAPSSGADVDPTIAPAGATTVAAADPSVGEQHFIMHCQACHQPGGVGMVGLAPSIRNRDFLAIASDDFIRRTVHNGRLGTAMVPRPDLDYSTVSEIISYLRALDVPNPISVTVDHDWKASGDAARGGEHFAIFCADCHGPRGEGYAAGGSGPGIGTPGFLDVASDGYILATLQHGRVGTPMRPFIGPTGLANLTDEEVGDIIVWLRKKG
jgi:cytochrome c oxidase cbb3-type subunit 3